MEELRGTEQHTQAT